MTYKYQSAQFPTGLDTQPRTDPLGYVEEHWTEDDLIQMLLGISSDSMYVPIFTDIPQYFNTVTDGVDDPDREWDDVLQIMQHSQPYAPVVDVSNFQMTVEDLTSELEREVAEAWEAARAEGLDFVFPGGIPQTDYSTDVCLLLSEIQRHLLENVNAGTSWSLWTVAEVLGFLNLRLQRFFVETGILREHAILTVAAGDLSVAVPSDYMEMRRVEWVDASGRTPLARIDAQQADTGLNFWDSTSGRPLAYIEEPEEAMTIQLFPTPSGAGTLDIFYIPVPETMTGICEALPVPNLFTPCVKWGVLADMLAKEGEANDPLRSQAAERRWQEGIELARALLAAKP